MDSRFYASDYQSRVDFMKIAEGFGLKVFDLAGGEPIEILARALNERGPCLIHAAIDLNEKVYPMVPPGAANTDMIGGEASVCA